MTRQRISRRLFVTAPLLFCCGHCFDAAAQFCERPWSECVPSKALARPIALVVEWTSAAPIVAARKAAGRDLSVALPGDGYVIEIRGAPADL